MQLVTIVTVGSLLTIVTVLLLFAASKAVYLFISSVPVGHSRVAAAPDMQMVLLLQNLHCTPSKPAQAARSLFF